MFSGRHLLLLGALACAGLVTVRDSHDQVNMGYQIAAQEKELRSLRKKIAAERTRLETLRAPARVLRRAGEMRLRVAPTSELSIYRSEQDAEESPAR